jgi:hypothetical protein
MSAATRAPARRYLLLVESEDQDLAGLRRLLKALARGYGLRCLRIEPAPPASRPGEARQGVAVEERR